MSKPEINEMTIPQLHAEIRELTGKKPTSRATKWLRARLADLRTRNAAGEDLKPPSGSNVRSFSMTDQAARALDEILGREKVKTSALVMRALALWAKANGYQAESDAMGGA